MADERDIRPAVRSLLRRGYHLVPLRPRSKLCTVEGWPELRLTEPELERHFSATSNAGILLGAPSRGLVDIDLDCGKTLALADAILANGTSTVKYQDPDGRPNEAMLVELRSTGCQTMAPGSIHPSGEPVEWCEDGEPAELNADELRHAVGRLAAAALLVRCYPSEGARHDYVLAVAGVLARALPEADAEAMLDAIARAARDEEHHARRADLRSTLRRLAAERPASGWPTLERAIGAARTRAVRAWLGDAESTSSETTATRAEPLERARHEKAQRKRKKSESADSAATYLIDGGRISYRKTTRDGSVTVALSNFTATIVEHRILDDGAE